MTPPTPQSGVTVGANQSVILDLGGRGGTFQVCIYVEVLGSHDFTGVTLSCTPDSTVLQWIIPYVNDSIQAGEVFILEAVAGFEYTLFMPTTASTYKIYAVAL